MNRSRMFFDYSFPKRYLWLGIVVLGQSSKELPGGRRTVKASSMSIFQRIV